MMSDTKIQEPNKPLYFIPKNIVITSLIVITATVALATISAFVVFLLNHYEMLQGIYSIIAYATVGGAGSFLTFVEILAGLVALAIYYTRDNDPKNILQNNAVIVAEDIEEGDNRAFEEGIQRIVLRNRISGDFEHNELKDFILDYCNNRTAMNCLIDNKDTHPMLLRLIRYPLKENSSNNWGPNYKVMNAIRKKTEVFQQFMHFLIIGEKSAFPIHLLTSITEEEKNTIFEEMIVFHSDALPLISEEEKIAYSQGRPVVRSEPTPELKQLYVHNQILKVLGSLHKAINSTETPATQKKELKELQEWIIRKLNDEHEETMASFLRGILSLVGYNFQVLADINSYLPEVVHHVLGDNGRLYLDNYKIIMGNI